MSALELIVPALIGLAGVWLGSWLTLRRSKQERAYDLRLTWYRDALQAVNGAMIAYKEAASVLRTSDVMLEVISEYLESADRARIAAMARLQEHQLFASPALQEAIEATQERMLEPAQEALEAEYATNWERLAGYCDVLSEQYEALAGEIASDGREILNL